MEQKPVWNQSLCFSCCLSIPLLKKSGHANDNLTHYIGLLEGLCTLAKHPSAPKFLVNLRECVPQTSAQGVHWIWLLLCYHHCLCWHCYRVHWMSSLQPGSSVTSTALLCTLQTPWMSCNTTSGYHGDHTATAIAHAWPCCRPCRGWTSLSAAASVKHPSLLLGLQLLLVPLDATTLPLFHGGVGKNTLFLFSLNSEVLNLCCMCPKALQHFQFLLNCHLSS